jgi:transcriptional regulator
MYVPPAFKEDDVENIRTIIRATRLANLVTATADGLMATPLPLFLDEGEGERGVLYGHVAKANPQWRSAPTGDALAIFMGPEAYVSPSWYATKQETGKVVPTWNYITVHAYGPIEFFQDFIAAQLRGIVGLRIPVTRFEGKRKMSQNRPEADRVGVAAGLAASETTRDREVASLIPTQS